ncbi:21652_t:CDS:2, partial [Entrophospora sp. SA101]
NQSELNKAREDYVKAEMKLKVWEEGEYEGTKESQKQLEGAGEGMGKVKRIWWRERQKRLMDSEEIDITSKKLKAMYDVYTFK